MDNYFSCGEPFIYIYFQSAWSLVNMIFRLHVSQKKRPRINLAFINAFDGLRYRLMACEIFCLHVIKIGFGLLLQICEKSRSGEIYKHFKIEKKYLKWFPAIYILDFC